MKKFWVVIGFLLLVGSGFAQEVKWFKGSFKEAQKIAAKENKVILINYFSGSG